MEKKRKKQRNLSQNAENNINQQATNNQQNQEEERNVGEMNEKETMESNAVYEDFEEKNGQTEKMEEKEKKKRPKQQKIKEKGGGGYGLDSETRLYLQQIVEIAEQKMNEDEEQSGNVDELLIENAFSELKSKQLKVCLDRQGR